MEIFVARQPIFDTRDRVFGYELLYRGSALATGAAGVSTSRMSSEVVVHAFLGIGVEQLTQGKIGFINFSREMLLEHAWELLDPGGVVIELLETIEPDEAAITACQQLKAAGYQLALDDFVYDRSYDPLLRQADIIKIDVLNRSPAELREAVTEVREAGAQLRPFGVRLLAERVETAAVRDGCRAMGFELFQGYHFSRPETLSGREVSVEQTAIIRLMNLLRDEKATDAEIEEAFRADPSLSYKLLRMVNSASLGGRGIESIRHAIRLVGRAVLHRWLALLLVSSLATESGADAELIHTAVLRAAFCERLAEAAGRKPASGPLFLVGLFSLIDALLKVPMQEIVVRIDLAPEVRDALLRRSGPYADVLQLVEAYERGEWDAVSGHAAAAEIPAADLPELYLASLAWARERVMGSER